MVIFRIAALLVASLFSSWALARGGDDAVPRTTCYFDTGTVSGLGAGLAPCVSPLPTCDGSTDDTASQNSAITWIKSTQTTFPGKIALVWPNGKNCKVLQSGLVEFAGIKDFLFWGYGSTISGDVPHFATGNGVWADAAHTVRINTVQAGSTSVTINPSLPTQPPAAAPSNGCATVAACAALFNVGDWAYVFEGDLQAGGGFPINPTQSQFVKITSVNASTGVVTFTEPLYLTYKSTLPSYNVAVPTYDYGGPATLASLHQDWDSVAEWRGITITSNTFTAIETNGRVSKWRDATCTASGVPACWAPTVNKAVVFFNVKTPGGAVWEV